MHTHHQHSPDMLTFVDLHFPANELGAGSPWDVFPEDQPPLHSYSFDSSTDSGLTSLDSRVDMCIHVSIPQPAQLQKQQSLLPFQAAQQHLGASIELTEHVHDEDLQVRCEETAQAATPTPDQRPLKSRCRKATAPASVKNTDAANKSRLRWTQDLHGKFLECVDALGGLDKATPKGILQHMSAAFELRDLSILHIKSHLQKYRLNFKADNAKRPRPQHMHAASSSGGEDNNSDESSSLGAAPASVIDALCTAAAQSRDTTSMVLDTTIVDYLPQQQHLHHSQVKHEPYNNYADLAFFFDGPCMAAAAPAPACMDLRSPSYPAATCAIQEALQFQAALQQQLQEQMEIQRQLQDNLELHSQHIADLLSFGNDEFEIPPWW